MEYYLTLKRKEILTHVTQVSFEDITLSKISQSQKENTVWFHLYEVSSVVKFIETESRMVIAGARGRGKWGVIV